MNENPDVIGYVVSVHGFRVKVEIDSNIKSSSRATLDGVRRAIAINSFLIFDLGAGLYAIGNLTDLEARESYDPKQDAEFSLELTKPRRIATVQLLGTVQKGDIGKWKFDPGVTILPTLDTPAEIATHKILDGIFSNPPKRNRPNDIDAFSDESTDSHNTEQLVHPSEPGVHIDNGKDENKYEEFDVAIELGHQAGSEDVKIKASFNDLFSRPLAIVGNTGSGKSYTVASLIRKLLSYPFSENKNTYAHVFILDINGEYANAFPEIREQEQNQEPKPAQVPAREIKPNEAYVNGRKFSLPLWLMNSKEICEWLSASEQTQEPVLKNWWASLKSRKNKQFQEFSPEHSLDIEYSLDKAYAIILDIRNVINNKTAKSVLSRLKQLHEYLAECELDKEECSVELFDKFIDAKDNPDMFNPRERVIELEKLLFRIESIITDGQPSAKELDISQSGDTPVFVSKKELFDVKSLSGAARSENVSSVDQHLVTLKLRLKSRLLDSRWSIFTNYEDKDLNIGSAKKWLEVIGFRNSSPRLTIIDLSMLSHEVLPFVCAVIGRILLEAREKLSADQRYKTPWVLVLEEAHNYARPAHASEESSQALSRKAFERVAKEGRKFGLSLIVASQRPSEISPTIISQCANFFSHRLQNPNDIDHFKRIIPQQAQRLLDQVTILSSGEAIVFGSALHIPSRVQIEKPEKEPWSQTAAPYREWLDEKALFPIDDVLKAWGVSEKGDAEELTPTSNSSTESK